MQLTLLCIFSFSVFHVVMGGKRLGFLTKPIYYFATFPNIVYEVLKSPELFSIPPTYGKRDNSFHQINRLDYDLYGINSFIQPSRDDVWEIRLFNFRNDSILHSWYLNKNQVNLKKGNRKFRNIEPRNCILLPDASLIAGCDESYNLFRIDRNSGIIWETHEKLIHHAINLDADSNLWVCTSNARGVRFYNSKNQVNRFRDDYITKYDIETGQILYDKSITEIFEENGYKYMIYGIGNQKKTSNDPIHLNDIQPALTDGKFWKKGDLFLSCRHRSVILVFRPSTNAILHLLQGPFLNQHDVDIISDEEIAIFNNNHSTIARQEYINPMYRFDEVVTIDSISNSEIIIYNFSDSTFRLHLEEHFSNERIFTQSQGFYEILGNGDTYVESQNSGKMYIMNEKEIILKKFFDTPLDNMVERPHWVRIYEHLNIKL